MIKTLFEILKIKLQIWKLQIETLGLRIKRNYHEMDGRLAAWKLNRITTRILNTATVREIQDHGADLATMGARLEMPAYVRFGEMLINEASTIVTARVRGGKIKIVTRYE